MTENFCNEAGAKRARKFLQAQLRESSSRENGGEGAARDVAEIFAALGDPTRLKLLLALAQSELCVGDLALVLGVSASATSHQLQNLRALRLVKFRRDGKMILYSLDDDHVTTLLQVGVEHARETRGSLSRGSLSRGSLSRRPQRRTVAPKPKMEAK